VRNRLPCIFFYALAACGTPCVADGDAGAAALPGPAPSPPAASIPRPVIARAPAPGVLLVASRDLHDPNFYRSVVLLVDADADGAAGVMINHPTGMPLRHALPGMDALEKRDDKLYVGGPVALNMISMLLRGQAPPPGAGEVVGRVYYSTSRETLVDVIESAVATEDVRFLFGIAGWGPGQLEGEILGGSWHLVAGSEALIFDGDPARLWDDLIHLTDGHWVESGARLAQARVDAGQE